MSEEIVVENQRIKPGITPRELVFKYIRYLPWLIVSVIILLAGAYIKLRYSTPIYNVSGKLLVTTQSPYGGGEKFDDIFMMQRSDKINDEIEIIRSRSMASRVIRSLGLQKQISNKGKIRSSIVYHTDVPFNFDILSIADSTRGFSVLVTLGNDSQFTLNEQPQKYQFNETVVLPSVTFRISSNNRSRQVFSTNDFVVSWVPLESVAAGLAGNIGVNRVNDFTNMLLLSYQTENTRLGIDIVNQYMKEYQQGSLEDKREIAGRTLQFIDDQLVAVVKDLGGVEKNLQQYREKNRLFSQEAQTQLFFDELSQSNKQMVEHGISLKVIDYLTGYLSDRQNQYKIIPSMLGITEPAFLQQVTEFNRLVLERESLIANTGAQNPTVLTRDIAIEKLRVDMVETLNNIRKTHLLALDEVARKNKEADQTISSIPSKEKQLLEVTRQQNILQELYSYLLQKKLETAIASASTISNIKMIESAMASGGPISPNRKGLYIMAFVVGLAIPAGIIFLREYLNDKVKSKTEIEQATNTPILGEIGHAEEKSALVVARNSRKFLAEQFRILRSNLQYILPKAERPVILVTSSFSGEGKSFVSTNLAAVLALSGKRTLIMEFDIRKPKIMQGLGLHEKKGITNYIVSNISLQELITPVPEVDNLYVMACGPVPPNPSEMLLNEKVEMMFAELKKNFDTIIIDSAPVGLVSDAITLGKYADATVYIVRHNYTLKKQLQLIDELYEHKKLPHLSIIINDINARAGYGSYYGYGGYGYGYGYGFGSKNSTNSYFDVNGGRGMSWWKKLTRSKK